MLSLEHLQKHVPSVPRVGPSPAPVASVAIPTAPILLSVESVAPPPTPVVPSVANISRPPAYSVPAL